MSESYLRPARETAPTEINLAGVGSPNVIRADESGKTFLNTGATAQVYHTLPAPRVGLTYTFALTDADGIRIVVADSATTTIQDSETASAGASDYIESTELGAVITLLATSTTQWLVVNKLGTWALSEA